MADTLSSFSAEVYPVNTKIWRFTEFCFIDYRLIRFSFAKLHILQMHSIIMKFKKQTQSKFHEISPCDIWIRSLICQTCGFVISQYSASQLLICWLKINYILQWISIIIMLQINMRCIGSLLLLLWAQIKYSNKGFINLKYFCVNL
jgi:hypothetical protein